MTVRHLVGRIAGSAWLRWAGAACLMAIVFLSLVPKTVQGVDESLPHGSLQHFIGYLTTAVVFSLAAKQRRNPIPLVVALAALAGLMEILQNFSPGRSPELEGFAWSSLGAVAGGAVGFLARPA